MGNKKGGRTTEKDDTRLCVLRLRGFIGLFYLGGIRWYISLLPEALPITILPLTEISRYSQVFPTFAKDVFPMHTFIDS